jgi:hypothetical protein
MGDQYLKVDGVSAANTIFKSGPNSFQLFWIVSRNAREGLHINPPGLCITRLSLIC